MRYLKTNTATRITVGPFLDKTDGITPETGLTATNEKLTFTVDDAGVPTLVLDTTATASSGANDMVHITGDDAGFYDLELAAANVNYVGRAFLAITYATDHLPVFHEFMILPAKVYDSLVGGTDNLEVDMVQALGVAVTDCDFTCATDADADTTKLTLPTTDSATVAIPNDASHAFKVIQVVGGTGVGQVIVLTTRVGSTRQWNCVGQVTQTDNTSKCNVINVARVASIGTDVVNAAAVATDVITEFWAKTCTEPTAAVAAAPTAIAALSWLLTLSRNKYTQTATTGLLKADDGTTTIATTTVSDDATTYTRGEFV